jgi:two-component system cell cycle sensor histidine kinase/response regulator CckA
MGGDEVYDRLKEIDPEVKVLLCSGYSIDDQAREIMECGCEGFIQKPFSMKAMSDKLSEVLPKRGAGGISQHSSNARIKGDEKCKSSK